MKFLVLAALLAGVLAVPTEDHYHGGDGGHHGGGHGGDHGGDNGGDGSNGGHNGGGGGGGLYLPCAGLAGSPVCCDVDVVGLLDTACYSPSDISSGKAFKQACTKDGRSPKCCVLSGLLNLGLICNDPIGIPR